MTSNGRSTGFILHLSGVVLILPLLMAGCSRETVPVSYQQDVAPLLAAHCGRCHQKQGGGTQKSGFAMDSYEQLLQGTRIGPVIKPGKATASTLVSLVEGRADPAIRMPPDGHNPLDPEQIALIRQWIDEGAKNN
jgi:mono/diheme cytochrome c family protein